VDYRRPLPRSQVELVVKLVQQHVILGGVVGYEQALEGRYGGRSDPLPQWALYSALLPQCKKPDDHTNESED
jgi:hypothetical protein